MRVALILFIVMAASARAQFEPSVWYYPQATSTAAVYVADCWMQQFPKREATGRNLIVAMPVAAWNALTTQQRARVKAGIGAMVSGTLHVSATNLAAWRATLADNGIAADVVDPGEQPKIGARLYVLLCADNVDGYERMIGCGLVPK